MWIQWRELRVLAAVAYLLLVTGAPLLHDHNHDERDQRPLGAGWRAAADCDQHDCSVCQFLAQEPTPIADIAPVGLCARVERLVPLTRPVVERDCFSAWRSRGPPMAG